MHGACLICGNAFNECEGHITATQKVRVPRKEQHHINLEGATKVLLELDKRSTLTRRKEA